MNQDLLLLLTVKQNGDVVMAELSAQMEDAAAATTKAYANLRHLRHMEKLDASNASSNVGISDEVITERVKEKEYQLSAKLLIMQPIFRFLQLLCENHNAELQVHLYFLLSQNHIYWDLVNFFCLR